LTGLPVILPRRLLPNDVPQTAACMPRLIRRVFKGGLRVMMTYAAWAFLSLLSIIAIATRRRIVVIVHPAGNLGNQLFLHANVVAFAIEHRAFVINAGFGHHRACFAGTRPGPVACWPSLPLPHIQGNLIERIVQRICMEAAVLPAVSKPTSRWASIVIDNPKRVSLDSPAFVAWAGRKHVLLITGWLFVSETSLPRHTAAVRSHCRQVRGNDASAMAPLTRLRRDCDMVMGVVVRHGDYRQFQQGRFFYEIPTYGRWIKELMQLFPDRRLGFFICCNDDVDLTELGDVRHEFRWGHDLENRAILASCDRIITPPSTYGGWAAFAGEVPLQVLESADQVI